MDSISKGYRPRRQAPPAGEDDFLEIEGAVFGQLSHGAESEGHSLSNALAAFDAETSAILEGLAPSVPQFAISGRSLQDLLETPEEREQRQADLVADRLLAKLRGMEMPEAEADTSRPRAGRPTKHRSYMWATTRWFEYVDTYEPSFQQSSQPTITGFLDYLRERHPSECVSRQKLKQLRTEWGKPFPPTSPLRIVK